MRIVGKARDGRRIRFDAGVHVGIDAGMGKYSILVTMLALSGLWRAARAWPYTMTCGAWGLCWGILSLAHKLRCRT